MDRSWDGNSTDIRTINYYWYKRFSSEHFELKFFLPNYLFYKTYHNIFNNHIKKMLTHQLPKNFWKYLKNTSYNNFFHSSVIQCQCRRNIPYYYFLSLLSTMQLISPFKDIKINIWWIIFKKRRKKTNLQRCKLSLLNSQSKQT